jgi:hypothetical protein
MTFSDAYNPRAKPLPVALLARDEAPVVTLELATRMLPLVRRITADLHTSWVAWRAAVTRLDTVLAALDADSGSALARTAQQDVDRYAVEIESLRAELVSLGADCRSPRTGRIEWNSTMAGAPVRLLWQPGEETVTRWEESSIAGDPALRSTDGDEDDPSRS